MSVKLNSPREVQNRLQSTKKIDARLFHSPTSDLEKRELKKLIDDAHRSEKPIIAIVMG
ncbi:MAG: hypothetical protein O3A32_08515 [Proteobacteria bacterium]|jgi:hypothetical protein|nr:hypothetical protein [Pseudomonadota bacterium]MDA1294780.1 hypothetical protein [Pseudomonadota bacterium]